MSKPQISVVIPVYNTEKYLRQCLDSVIGQTISDIEIICVNDGSTDSSLSILEEYANNDNRIIVVNKENGGLSSARNVGLNKVSSELVYFLDSDDYIKNNLFEYALNIFNNFDIDYFCFSSECSYDVGIVPDRGLEDYIKARRDGFYDIDFNICLNTNIHVWNKIFKTSKIREFNISFQEGLLFEDIYFVWKYFFLSNTAYYDNNTYHNYRISNNSIMKKIAINPNYNTAIHHMYNWHSLVESLFNYKEVFIRNYDNLLILLGFYVALTKQYSPTSEKYKTEILKREYLIEMQERKEHILNKKSFFFIDDYTSETHTIFNIMGIYFKLKKQRRYKCQKYQ